MTDVIARRFRAEFNELMILQALIDEEPQTHRQREDIIGRLVENGVAQADISRAIDVHPAHVNRIVQRYRRRTNETE